ncbi:MAG: hypothetical protein EAZ57_06295 [Cytophagales bacterium]|nr:MAG: hypothetical protein EAZ67_13805 [Cytophagales bacterium]TAF60789.1 MAG: hypothetical protein EAZ57_06295 [Cytophagales bacterium]
MLEPNTLFFQGQIKSIEKWLKELPSDPYLSDVLSIIRAWRSGQTSFLLHTSGTTGTPKPVWAQREAIEASIRLSTEKLVLQHGMTALLPLNVQFVGGFMLLLRALTLNMGIYLQKPQQAIWKGLPSNFHADFTAISPLQLHSVIEKGELDFLEQHRIVLIGGAPVSKHLLNAISDSKTAFFHTYGMTETLSHIAFKRLSSSQKQAHFETISPEIRIWATKDKRLCIQSPTAYNGQIIETNDLVEIIDEQTFDFVGRADFVINTGGIKVSPEQIEAQLSHFLSGILKKEWAVSDLKSDLYGSIVVLVITEKLSPDVQKFIFDYSNSHLPRYHTPKQILELEALPLTTFGKLQRQELRVQINERSQKY